MAYRVVGVLQPIPLCAVIGVGREAVPVHFWPLWLRSVRVLTASVRALGSHTLLGIVIIESVGDSGDAWIL